MSNSKSRNWKARLSGRPDASGGTSNSYPLPDVSIEVKDAPRGTYDESNPLVLPSKREKLKRPAPTLTKPQKLLSKKQRKRLEKILERKEKKENRSSLLAALQDVQIPAKELEKMASLTRLQTLGLRKAMALDHSETPKERKLNAIKGHGKIPSVHDESDSDTEATTNPNVVGLDNAYPSSDESDDVEMEGNERTTPNGHVFVPKVETSSTQAVVHETEDSTRDQPYVTCGRWNVEPTPRRKKESVYEVLDGNEDAFSPQTLIDTSVRTKLPEERKPVVHVPVFRPEEIERARLKLPILAEEQVVMETINSNAIVAIAGETGSGKTTQLPQFLYEAGYANSGLIIGVTEPRRVAAISMSKRVGYEMNLSEEEVSYQIRYEGNTTDKTKILFMTDGVLLKEVQKDFLLSRYSVIIVDEAHERSVYTDILVGLLSRIVPLRAKRAAEGNPLPPLKLIIMSATLRVEDFTCNPRLFRPPPPVVSVESRQFPVTVHFNRRTPSDYVAESYKKVCKIHRRLPDGGILVFLTGQQEVNSLCRKLRRAFPAKPLKEATKPTQKLREEEAHEVEEEDEGMKRILSAVRGSTRNKEPKEKQRRRSSRRKPPKGKNAVSITRVNLDDYDPAGRRRTTIPAFEMEGDEEDEMEEPQSDEEEDDVLDTDDEDEFLEEMGDEVGNPTGVGLHVLPLYSLLPAAKQAKVFEPPPPNTRLCIVATNVAETSLTIPGVRYVVDSGKTKRRFYDKTTGVSAFFVVWTSRASASQRAGRAGRQGPGHCYRLYSSAVFGDEMEEFSVPEIKLRPVDDLVLRMKAMNIHRVQNFPFPTAPGRELIAAAEKRLRILGALQPKKESENDQSKAKSHPLVPSNEILVVTPLGRTMAAFPVSPRYAKMLALSKQGDFPALMLYAVAMIAAFAVPEVLLERAVTENPEKKDDSVDGENVKKPEARRWTELRRKWAGLGNSRMLGDAYILLKSVAGSDWAEPGKLELFCASNGIRTKALTEVRKLRTQLTNEANLLLPGLELPVNPKLRPPSDHQCKLLRQIVLSGLVDQVAIRVDSFEEFESAEEKKRWRKGYRCAELADPVFIHPSSVLFEELPKLVVYQEIIESSGKMSMRGVVAIEADWLPRFAPELCVLSDPLPDPPPAYDSERGLVMCHCTATYGPSAWDLGVVNVEHPVNVDKFRYFAEALLLGNVLEPLAKFVGNLVAPPATIFKSWAKLQKRIDLLLDTLMAREVDSKQKLLKELQKDPKYLLAAYLEWIAEDKRNEVTLAWPPIPPVESDEEESE